VSLWRGSPASYAAARPPIPIICVLRNRALWRKVSDEFTVPLCRVHHDELHRHGDEAAYWNALKIDPVPIALALWRLSRPNGAGGPKRAAVRPQATNGEDIAKLPDE